MAADILTKALPAWKMTLFKNNYNFEKKSIISSLLKLMNLKPLHQGGLPLQLLVDLHHLLSQQSIGMHKLSVPVN